MTINKSISAVCVVSIVFLLSVHGCKKSNPVETTDNFPDRANYTLILETGATVDSIFVIKVDGNGNGLAKIPSPDKYATWPLVSPNGQLLAFRPGTDFMSMYLYNLVTGQSTPILTEANWDEYAWSPSGDSIVFSGDKTTGGFAIRILDVSSGISTPLTDSIAGNERYPHWLPYGNTVAYVHYDTVNTARTLYAFKLQSNQIDQLVPGQREASWSPDGSKFFAGGKIYSWPSLSLVRDVSSVSPGEELFARWFPNSIDLLIQTGTPDDGLYKVNALSGASQKIINGSITFKAVSISADSKYIAIIPGGSNNNRFIVADSDGQNQRSITLSIPGANYRRIQFVGDVVW